jgi:hypothetical protein
MNCEYHEWGRSRRRSSCLTFKARFIYKLYNWHSSPFIFSTILLASISFLLFAISTHIDILFLPNNKVHTINTYWRAFHVIWSETNSIDIFISFTFDSHLIHTWSTRFSIDSHLIHIWSTFDLHLIHIWSTFDPHLIHTIPTSQLHLNHFLQF